MPFTVLDPSTAQAAPVTNLGAPAENNGMELQDIRAEVLGQLQNRTDVTQGGADYTRLDRWINWGYLGVAQILDLKELWASVSMPTVADQPFYLLPNAISWIKKVVIDDEDFFLQTGGRELALIDVDTYRNLPDSDEIQASPLLPQSWFRYARMLVEWPTPDDIYSIAVDVRIRPLPLIQEQDCPLLPEEFHEGIVYAAIERAWRALRNPAAAAAAANDKLSVIRPLLNTDAEERSSEHIGFAPARSRSALYRGMI